MVMHAGSLRKHGGQAGIRDIGELRRALAIAETRFGDAWLHGSLAEMASAYLYHVIEVRPFVDGNKRTGLLAAVVFLGLNGFQLTNDDGLAQLVLGVGAGQRTKSEAAVYFQERLQPIQR